MTPRPTRLDYNPASTNRRPVLPFAVKQKTPLELQVIDLFAGEHHQPPYVAINPNHRVPALEDGDFRLTESSAILKCLAGKIGSPLSSQDSQAHARVNERMDWANTQLRRGAGLRYARAADVPLSRRNHGPGRQRCA